MRMTLDHFRKGWSSDREAARSRIFAGLTTLPGNQSEETKKAKQWERHLLSHTFAASDYPGERQKISHLRSDFLVCFQHYKETKHFSTAMLKADHEMIKTALKTIQPRIEHIPRCK